ncbi:MAG: PH domain-containing protein [Chloroflexi bacterium]|nr:PH domain-containing protein [Chloroflexota bacterium]
MRSQNKSTYVVYQEAAKYDLWLILLLVFIILLDFSIGVIIFFIDPVGFYVLFADGLFLILLFYFVLPRRYEIYSDHLRIVLGWPVSMNIPLSTIREIKSADNYESMIFWGMKFATSSKTAIVILRSKGISVVISPTYKQKFTEHLVQATKGN